MRLERFVYAQQGREFRYGIFDCCLFVCGAIEAMTGVNPAREFLGAYSTRREARKLLAAAGGISAIAKRHGMTELPVSKARRGDVLAMKNMQLALVALNGKDALVVVESGLIAVPARIAIGAWAV